MRARAAAPRGGLGSSHPFSARPREAKDPINASAGSGTPRAFQRGGRRDAPRAPLENSPNYPSVTSWPAWRGAACEAAAGMGSQLWRVRAAPGTRESCELPANRQMPACPVLPRRSSRSCLPPAAAQQPPERGLQPTGKTLFSAFPARCSLLIRRPLKRNREVEEAGGSFPWCCCLGSGFGITCDARRRDVTHLCKGRPGSGDVTPKPCPSASPLLRFPNVETQWFKATESR